MIVFAALVVAFSTNNQKQLQPKPKVDSAVQPTTPETATELADKIQHQADENARIRAAIEANRRNLARQKQGLPPEPSALPGQPYTPAAPVPAEILKRNDTLHSSILILSFREGAAQQTAPTNPDALLRDIQQQSARLKDQIAANIAETERLQSMPATPPSQTYTYERRPEPKTPEPQSSELTEASGPLYRVFEGTTLEGILLNRIDGTYSGPVNAIITTPVYSHDDQHVLIPIGSKVLGDAKQVTSTGDRRLAVTFHRLLMPDAFSVNLDAMPGMDQAGAMGLTGKVNSHYMSIFGASLAIGAIGGLAQIGNGYSGFGYDPSVQFRNGISESMGQSSSRVLDRFLNKLPTVTIREGTRLKVYFTGDLQLPDYSAHRVKGDI